MTGNNARRDFDRHIDEVEENIRVLVETQLEVQHQLDAHRPAVSECPTCRRLQRVA